MINLWTLILIPYFSLLGLILLITKNVGINTLQLNTQRIHPNGKKRDSKSCYQGFSGSLLNEYK